MGDLRRFSTVRQGSRGPDVVTCQEGLSALGYTLSVDGVFGPATERATRSFQLSTGLTVDGVVGGKTWKRLNALTDVL